jgi:hypothetical protein
MSRTNCPLLSVPFRLWFKVQNGKESVAHDYRDISNGVGIQTFSVDVDRIPDAPELNVFVALYGRVGNSSDARQFTYKVK